MRICLLVLLSSLLAACSGAGEPVAHALIGASGGTLEARGIRLQIPAGALSGDTDISITTEELEDGGLRFHLGPDGLELARPATVRLDYDPSADPEGTAVILHDSSVHGTEIIATSTDAEAGQIFGPISSFSSVQRLASLSFDPLPGADFKVLATTPTGITLYWTNAMRSPVTGYLLQWADGLGFHTDAEFAANEVLIAGGQFGHRVGDHIEYNYIDHIGQPGFGRNYRLIPYITRNGHNYGSPQLLAAGFTLPGERFGMRVAALGDGVVSWAYTSTSPSGPTRGTLMCPPQCETNFAASTDVDLIATPAPGGAFLGWGGDCTSPADRLSLRVTRAMGCEARFTRRAKDATFFVTQEGNALGGSFGGLAGADARCQAAAAASTRLSQAARSRTWRAFLGKTCDASRIQDCEIAIERIGSGPWYNLDGVMVDASALADGRAASFLTENGNPLGPDDDEVATGFGSAAPRRDLDGDGAIGDRDAYLQYLVEHHAIAGSFGFSGGFCENWSNANNFATAAVGHADWRTAHDAGPNPPATNDALRQLTATHSFERSCGGMDEGTQNPSGKVARGRKGWHLYCFAN